MSENTLLPFDLPSVAGKKLSVGFDGGQFSSDAGVLVLRGVAARVRDVTQRQIRPSGCLVQETLLRAIANINSFQPGTNMSTWLFTILRNLFRSEYRKRRREVEDSDGSYAFFA